MVLMQYTKALGYLRALLAESNDRQRCAETALVACLLFMCLEMLQCNQLGAVAHLRTGLRILAGVSNQDVILNERNAGDSRVTPSVGLNPTLDQHLSPVFTRLDYEAIVFGERGPLLSLRSSQGSSGAFCIPRAFASLSEARHYLDILASAVLRFRGELLDLATLFLKDNEELDSARRHCLQYAYTRLIDFSQHPGLARRLEDLTTNLIQWSTAFKQLTNIQQSRAHFQLEIQHFYYFFLISTSQDAQELNCDRFNPSFARSLSLARKFTANPTNPQSTFTLESAIIPCLYLISLKCRDPGMRREAIDLLSRTPTQEGMWQGALFAKFIRHVVDLEEGPGNPGTTSSDIPEAARFSEIVLAVTEQQARIISAKVQDGEVHIGESIWPFLTYRHTILS